MKIGIYCVMYGQDSFQVHKAFIDRCPEEVSLNLWLNDCPDQTRNYIASRKRSMRVKDNGPHNTGKTKVWDWWKREGMPEDYLLCVDDDTLILAPDWCAELMTFLETRPSCFGLVVWKRGVLGLHGSFWGIKKEVLYSLDWPNNMEGETENGLSREHYWGEDDLAIAVKEAGLTLTPWTYGYRPNTLHRGKFKPH